jgi:hypothetical protein
MREVLIPAQLPSTLEMARDDLLDLEAFDEVEDVAPGLEDRGRLDLFCPEVSAAPVPAKG